MNTLSDTLNDLVITVIADYSNHGRIGSETNFELRERLVEEYVKRIKNELNVEKYLK
jgi:hypothetical protein